MQLSNAHDGSVQESWDLTSSQHMQLAAMLCSSSVLYKDNTLRGWSGSQACQLITRRNDKVPGDVRQCGPPCTVHVY